MEDCVMGSASHADLTDGPATETSLAGMRTDADLVAEMKTRLTREAWLSNRGIWVDARDGTIALVGVVDSEAEKAALATMARGIDGCTGIENHLLVRSRCRDYGIAYQPLDLAPRCSPSAWRGFSTLPKPWL
jgi:osmotically-inducible protein OsmY